MKTERTKNANRFAQALMGTALLALASAGHASIIRVSETDFIAGSGLITFSEYTVGTINPVYEPARYGGSESSPTVTFGGWFTGQALSPTPVADCPGAAASACVVGDPTGPLSLDPAAPNTSIRTDGSNPTSPVLSGSPTFNGPIAVLFDKDQVGVGFDGGFFDAVGSTGITAFARDGTLLGTVVNETIGIEFLGLVSATGQALISGVFLDLVGREPAGFAIDNLRFGIQGQVVIPGTPVPTPGPLGLLLTAGLGLMFARGRNKGAAAC